MSTSAVFFSFGTTLIRTQKKISLFSSPRRVTKTKPFFFLTLNRPNTKIFASSSSPFSSAAAALETTHPDSRETTPFLQHHPWPEWVAFVDKLKSRGYLAEKKPSSKVTEDISLEGENNENEMGVDTGFAGDSVYRDMNVLKDACLNFARDRFDVFKSLSKDDIQAVVEGGCPNIFRKVVNSAKRLRMYTGLDEADVCGVCILRQSCDRAYVTLKEFEAASRTLDITRILLFYALDQSVISDDMKTAVRGKAEMSARRLLSELTELSEEPLSPELEKPSLYVSCQKQISGNLSNHKASQRIERREGDWTCPKCNFLNFSRNGLCMKCNEANPLIVPDESGTRKPDWVCPECKFVNFARNARCLKCKADGPMRYGTNDGEKRKGDWICSKCCFLNYSSRFRCLKCDEPGPEKVVDQAELKKGDWECPECFFVNFARNVECRKCKADGPKRVEMSDGGRKIGDWTCPQCRFVNFASNSKCLRCPERRPPRTLKPGDWECPSCDFVNFQRNLVCRKCNCDRPQKGVSPHGNDEWERPGH